MDQCRTREWRMCISMPTHAFVIAALLVFCSWGAVDAGASRSIFFDMYNISQASHTQPVFLDKLFRGLR